ncbi:major capsid protein [Brachybacterium paraconglomeratum]|uniref:major capsid protein n=1 Tax=Brachybacterium paraconglomeratum TaxID=173362 RepID=UPI0037C83AD7
MAVTLAQAAALEADPVRRGALETATEVSLVWDRLPFENIEGNAYAYDKDKVLPGTGFRTVNEAYVESTGVINQDTERLSILGGDADVDQFIEKTMQSSRGVLMADQVRMKLESAQATYVDTMFNGDVEVDPKSFDGLRKRLVGSQVIDSAAPANTEGFLDELDELFGSVAGGPDVVYAPAQIISRLKSLGRKVGGADYINSEITGKREFTWNGVSFIDPGEHWSGRKILGYDATNGGDVYALKLASGIGVSGVLGITNGGLNAYFLGELQEKPAIRTRIDFYTGMAVQGGKAAARLRAVKTA